MSGRERDEAGLAALEDDHRVLRRPASLRGAPGVEDPRLPHARQLGNVRMSVGDRVAVGKGFDETRVPPGGTAGVVQEPDPQALGFDHEPSGQRLTQRGLVHVAVHRSDRSELLELLENRPGRHVSGMEDELGPLEQAHAFLRKPAGAARQMRVSDERDQKRSGKNSPFR